MKALVRAAQLPMCGRAKKEHLLLTLRGRSLTCLAPLSAPSAFLGLIFGILGGLESKRVSLLRLVCVDLALASELRGPASRSRLC